MSQPHPPRATAAYHRESERLLHLRHAGFVGRVAELADLQAMIDDLRPTGGYVVVTGDAGVGKSSLIAHAIIQAGIDQTPYHFIALTPGRAYQVELLRHVIGQLVRKYPDAEAAFSAETYPALRLTFLRIVHDLAAQGVHETIYLDGLDQLQPDLDGLRDITFLPLQLPPGIVIVLGSRPDEALDRLGLDHGVVYAVPPLREADVLQRWQQVQLMLNPAMCQPLVRSVAGNALLVALAATLLSHAAPTAVPPWLAEARRDPSTLFRVSLDRIKHHDPIPWQRIIRPMLAVLVVTQEPLLPSSIAALIEQPVEQVQAALGLVSEWVSVAADQRLALRHLMFYAYLAQHEFAAADVRVWHQRLAVWCGIGLETIWEESGDPAEQARRWYARHHYVTHLALGEHWATLWQVIDAGTYGEYKVRFDPTRRLYGLDVDRARDSVIAAGVGAAIDEQLAELPRLWRYSLLRTSLTANADGWLDDMFVIVAASGRLLEAEAQIALCSDPKRQVQLWSCILPYAEPERRVAILQQMELVARNLRDADDRDRALGTVGMAYIDHGMFAVGYPLIRALAHNRDSRLYAAVVDRVDQGDSAHAQVVMAAIQTPTYRVQSALLIAKALLTGGAYEDAYALLMQIRPMARDGDLNTLLCLLADIQWAWGNLSQSQLLLAEAEGLLPSIAHWDYPARFRMILDGYLRHGDRVNALRCMQQGTDDRVRYEIVKLYLTHADAVTASQVAPMIAHDGYRDGAYKALIRWYCHQQDLTTAHALLALIVEDQQHIEGAYVVAKAYAERQQFDAMDACLTMALDDDLGELNFFDFDCVFDVVELYARFGFHQRACAILARIFPLIRELPRDWPEELPEWIRFAEITNRYAYAAFYDDLVRAVFIPKEPHSYATAVGIMAQGYAMHGDFTRAEQLASALTSPDMAITTLHALAGIAQTAQRPPLAAHYLSAAHTRLNTIADATAQIAWCGRLATTAWTMGLTDVARMLIDEGRQRWAQLPMHQQGMSSQRLVEGYQGQENLGEALAITQLMKDSPYYQQLIETLIAGCIKAQDLDQAYDILKQSHIAVAQYVAALCTIAITAREQGNMTLAAHTCAEALLACDRYPVRRERLNFVKDLAISQLTHGSDACLPQLLAMLRSNDPRWDVPADVAMWCAIAAVYADQGDRAAFAEWLSAAYAVTHHVVQSEDDSRWVSIAYETLANTYLAYADEAAIHAFLADFAAVVPRCVKRGDASFAMKVLSQTYAHYAIQYQPSWREKAYQVARAIPDLWLGENTLAVVATAYVRVHDHAGVNMIIQEMRQRKFTRHAAMIQQHDNLCTIALAYAEQGDHAHAVALIAPLAPSYQRDRVLKVLIEDYRQADQWDAVYHLVDTYYDLTERVAVVQQIITAYRERQRIRESIALVHSTWRSGQSAAALWSMSASILPFLPDDPSLGLALLDAVP